MLCHARPSRFFPYNPVLFEHLVLQSYKLVLSSILCSLYENDSIDGKTKKNENVFATDIAVLDTVITFYEACHRL